MLKKEYKHTSSGFIVLCILVCLSTFQAGAAVDTSSQAETNQQITPAAEKTNELDDWVYDFENRPDPFLPFIEEKVATKNIPEEEDVVLTGMQVFEPGQLKLVAIIFSPVKKFAMVEDVTGKGYIINEGMLIGRHGVVSQINKDEVNITETRIVGGKEVTSPVAMRLNKEGDK